MMRPAVHGKMIWRAAVVLFFVCVLCSCSAIGGLFGQNKYDNEAVVRILPTDGEEAETLSEMVRMLSVNSPIIPEFDGIGEAMKSCRDSVLNYMLLKNYGKYTGNIEKLDAAVAEYPQMQITNLIPAREFEETVYAAFGGNWKISNESGRLFIYLDKVSSYTSVTVLNSDPISIEVIELAETENTYRMRVKNTVGDIVSPEYSIVFIKRDDGTAYFKSVKKQTGNV